MVSVTPTAYKQSDDVTTKTLRKRTLQVKSALETASTSSKESMLLQTGLLVKSFDIQERKRILELAKIERSYINAENLVAMKADLGMPWDKMKAMSRWLKMFNIHTDSNDKQRVIAKQF